MEANEGTQGYGYEGYTKYEAKNAPVTKNGGNTEEQDGVVTTQTPASIYGGRYNK